MCLTHSLFNGCVYGHLCVCFGGGGWGVMTGRMYDSTPISLLISLTRTEQKGRICRQPYCIVCVFVFVCAHSVFFISLRWMMMIGTCDSFDLVLTLSWCPQGNWDNLQKKKLNKKISCGRIKKHVCVSVCRGSLNHAKAALPHNSSLSSWFSIIIRKPKQNTPLTF